MAQAHPTAYNRAMTAPPENPHATAEFTIRAMRMDDLADFVETMSQPRAVWGTLQLPFATVEKRRAFLERVLSDANALMLAAEVSGRVVGNLGLHWRGDHPRRKHAAKLGMSVHDDYAGRGIGTALVREALNMADNWLQITRVELDVFVDNEPALALYRKFGFEIEGTFRNFAFRDGEFVDCHAMARLRP
jgi:putative acetyltransferase